MWFKNLVLYRLTEPFDLTPEQLGAALSREAFRPCGGLEPFSAGWSPPLGRLGSELVHAAHGRTLIALRREERLLPPAVVRETLEERIDQIEHHEGRQVRGKERRRIRDEIVFDLMPKAFTRSRHTRAYLSPRDGWLVVDASSPARAEDLVTLLARTCPSFEAAPFGAEHSPHAEMTAWLSRHEAPASFVLQDECELRDPVEHGAVVRCQRQDLAGEEIRAHLSARKQVQRLALGFEERLSLVLCADLTVKRLRFDSVEELDDMDESDEMARLDANFAFMGTELERLLSRLYEIFVPAPVKRTA